MPMNKKKWMIIVLFLFMLFSWGASIYLEHIALENYDGVSVRFEGEGVLKSDLENAMEYLKESDSPKSQSIWEVTAWRRGIRVKLQNETLSTSTKTRIIQVYGSIAKVCPMKVLYGSFGYEGDTKGCVIDEKTAYDLFRDKNVVGNFITYENKKYIIRGVVKSKEQMVLIREQRENITFPNLEFFFSNQIENGEEYAKRFINQYQLSKNDMVIIEGNYYAKLLHNSVLLPALVLWVYFLILSGKKAFQKRTIPLQCIFYMSLFLIISILFLYYKPFHFYYPSRLIPTRWSDFDFWVRIMEEEKKKRSDFLYLLPVPKDIILKNIILWCNLFVLFTISQMVVLIKQLRRRRDRL